MDNDKNKKSIQDKLANIKYNCCSETHLILDKEKCAQCEEKTCTFICPADVYSEDKQTGNITVQYENCLECGACKIVCPKDAITWQYPKGGKGVVFRNN